jgi:hypothetical protein
MNTTTINPRVSPRGQTILLEANHEHTNTFVPKKIFSKPHQQQQQQYYLLVLRNIYVFILFYLLRVERYFQFDLYKSLCI